VSLLDAIDGLEELLQSVDELETVLVGEPSEIPTDEISGEQLLPLAYILFDGARPIVTSGPRGADYDLMVRVLIRWKDNEDAERDLAPVVDAIREAFDVRATGGHAKATLGGRVNTARVTAIASGEQAGFHTIAEEPYRSATFTIAVMSKG
jgi:hypothetical protein